MNIKRLLLLSLLVLVCGCAKKVQRFNQRQTDKCMAKYHDASKCKQLTYPSCEQSWDGEWCHQ